jgi:hypothetical protein
MLFQTIMTAKYPLFRRDKHDRLSLTDSTESKTALKKGMKIPKNSQEMKLFATEQVRSRGGDILNRTDVLGK